MKGTWVLFSGLFDFFFEKLCFPKGSRCLLLLCLCMAIKQGKAYLVFVFLARKKPFRPKRSPLEVFGTAIENFPRIFDALKCFCSFWALCRSRLVSNTQTVISVALEVKTLQLSQSANEQLLLYGSTVYYSGYTLLMWVNQSISSVEKFPYHDIMIHVIITSRCIFTFSSTRALSSTPRIENWNQN